MKVKYGVICAILAIVLGGGYFAYMAWAFPENKCEAAKHLASGDMDGDCYGCHIKVSPKVAQYWYESKHGITLVRCQVCHGMPDGKGAIQFARVPSIDVCARCHSVAIERMQVKFGMNGRECYTCHPNHQSAIHGVPYQYRQPITKTDL